MSPMLFIPERYESRFGLLSSFCAEVAAAARVTGVDVNPHIHASSSSPSGPAIFLIFNEAATIDSLRAWMAQIGGAANTDDPACRALVVQWLVDHPLHAREPFITGMCQGLGRSYRLACVSEDDLHLVSVRWPSLHRMRLWHGVPDSAIAPDEPTQVLPPGRPGHREIDVFLAGSIATTEELDRLRSQVPAELHRACEELARVRLSIPWMSFGQAFDMTMPAALQCDAAWGLLSIVFRYTTAALNRERRIRLVRSLDGLNVTVAGGTAWAEVCAGLRAVTHVGEVPYGDLPSWIRRSKVCVSINPTQFVHAFSERLLLGLAGGAACVSDDRLWVRHEFSACTRLFPSQDSGALRTQVEMLLRDDAERARLAAAGVKLVRDKHTWKHRVAELISLLASK